MFVIDDVVDMVLSICAKNNIVIKPRLFLVKHARFIIELRINGQFMERAECETTREVADWKFIKRVEWHRHTPDATPEFVIL